MRESEAAILAAQLILWGLSVRQHPELGIKDDVLRFSVDESLDDFACVPLDSDNERAARAPLT